MKPIVPYPFRYPMLPGTSNSPNRVELLTFWFSLCGFPLLGVLWRLLLPFGFPIWWPKVISPIIFLGPWGVSYVLPGAAFGSVSVRV